MTLKEKEKCPPDSKKTEYHALSAGSESPRGQPDLAPMISPKVFTSQPLCHGHTIQAMNFTLEENNPASPDA